MNELYARRLSELQGLDWSIVGTSSSPQDATDAKAFLSNLAAFLLKRKITGNVNPFHSIADELKNMTDLDIPSFGNPSIPITRFVADGYLRTSLSSSVDIQGIYTPLIDIFRRGGSIDYHHNELIVQGIGAITLQDWIRKYRAASD